MKFYFFDSAVNRLSKCDELEGEFASDVVTVIERGPNRAFAVPESINVLDYFLMFLLRQFKAAEHIGRAQLDAIDQILKSAGLL